MSRRRQALWLLFPLLTLLAACLPMGSPAGQFEAARRDFAERLRWLDIPGAARHLAPAQREDFLRRFADLTDLHITDVRLGSAEADGEGKRVVAWSTIEYYHLPSTTVKTFRYSQDWEYRDGGRFEPGNWLIVSPFPDFFEAPATKRENDRSGGN